MLSFQRGAGRKHCAVLCPFPRTRSLNPGVTSHLGRTPSHRTWPAVTHYKMERRACWRVRSARPGAFAMLAAGSPARAQGRAHSRCSANSGRMSETSRPELWFCPHLSGDLGGGCGQTQSFPLPPWLPLCACPLPTPLFLLPPSSSPFLHIPPFSAEASEPRDSGSSPCSAPDQL